MNDRQHKFHFSNTNLSTQLSEGNHKRELVMLQYCESNYIIIEGPVFLEQYKKSNTFLKTNKKHSVFEITAFTLSCVAKCILPSSHINKQNNDKNVSLVIFEQSTECRSIKLKTQFQKYRFYVFTIEIKNLKIWFSN